MKYYLKILLIFSIILFNVGITVNETNAAHRTEDQYPSKFNKLIPDTYPHISGTHRHENLAVNHNFYKNGYKFNVYTTSQQLANGRRGDIDPIVVGVDDDKNVSNHQVWKALEGYDIRVSNFIYYRIQAYREFPKAELYHIFSKILNTPKNLFLKLY